MRWLIFAIIFFAQQPAKLPKNGRAIKSVVSKDAQQPNAGNNNQANSAASPPNLPQVPAANPETNTTETHKDVTRQGTDLVEVLTGLLVFVGFLQAGVMVFQLCTYRRQAVTMDRQAKEMIRQRSYMRRQWRVMREQAAEAKRQVGEMEKQTVHLETSVAVAGTSAKAALRNAESAQQSVEMFISKERARLRVEMKPLTLTPKFKSTAFHTVDFNVAIDGPTPAYVTSTSCVAFAMPSTFIAEKDTGCAVMMNMPTLPQVILPNSVPTEHFALFLSSDSDVDTLLPEIRSGNFLVGIRGFIRYRDVFDRDHETTFRYAWRFSEFYGLGEHGSWEKCGQSEENRDT